MSGPGRGLRVVVIEDHELLAQSLSLALTHAAIEVDVPPLRSTAEVVAHVAADLPDVVLLDLQLGGRIPDGESLIAPLTAAGTKVLVVTAVTDRYRLAATVEAGAVGFLAKSEPFDVLLGVIRRVAAGEQILPADVRQQLMLDLRQHRSREWSRTSLFRRLTQREQEVLAALCDGMTVENIASEWCVSVATVRSQVRAVLTKLDVKSQLTAVALARKSGWSLAAQQLEDRLGQRA